jgi:hypothetical protein
MVNIAESKHCIAIYNATPDHEKLRAIFQCYLEDEPLSTLPFEDKVKECFDVATANRIIKLAELNVEFKKWFITGNIEFRVRLKLLEQKAMSALEEVLMDQDPKSAGARVNASKYLLELAGKTAKSVPQPTQKLEDAIANMSEAELKMLMSNADGSETSVEIKKGKPKKIIDV